MKKILTVVGTRPNFMKVTQFRNEAAKFPDLDLRIVHTGQHFDERMSQVFFQQFGLVPDHFLNIPAASPNTQMAEIMLRLEKDIADYQPDCIAVCGDVNSTFAAALTANKMGIQIAHVESGLRSRDREMPEEINRILTDEIAQFLFVTEQSGLDNLKAEGKSDSRVHFVGNTMIDTMVAFDSQIDESTILDQLDLQTGTFVLMTMHRPATVDNEAGLNDLIALIESVTSLLPIVFPIHPRTVARLKSFGLYEKLTGNPRLILSEPMGYFAFQKLIKNCAVILTDSGGIQEEATFRQVPCLTLRPSTERPVTVDVGSNLLVTFDREEVHGHVESVLNGTFKKGEVPPLWDGKATSRIMQLLNDKL